MCVYVCVCLCGMGVCVIYVCVVWCVCGMCVGCACVCLCVCRGFPQKQNNMVVNGTVHKAPEHRELEE